MSYFLDAVDFVRDLLLADSLLVNGNGGAIGGIGSRLYTDFAPTVESQVYPFVIVTLNAGGANNDFKTNLIDLRLLVKVIAEDMVQASFLGHRIYVALHDADAEIKVDFAVYRCELTTAIHLANKEAERRFYHDGGIYRIRLSQ